MKKKTVLIGAAVLLLALVIGLLIWKSGSGKAAPETEVEPIAAEDPVPAAPEAAEPATLGEEPGTPAPDTDELPHDESNMNGEFTPLEIEEDVGIELDDDYGEAGG